MRGEQPAIEAQGARLAFVGNGSTAQAREFARRHAPGSAIFTDPSAYTYRAIGARQGAASTLGGMVVHGVRAMRGGHFQTSIEGRPFQHGGVLIAMPGDRLGYAYLSRIAGDHPPSAAVLDALRAAVRDAALAAAPRVPFVWQPPPAAPTPPPEPAEPAATAPPPAPAAAVPTRSPLPPWPGQSRPATPPRAPRWSFPRPSSEPPHSAAG